MLTCSIEFEPGKFARFEHIYQLFQIDQQQNFRLLYRLKPEDFNFSDSYVKLKVSTAARQLSHMVAIGLEMYSLKDGEDANIPNRLPPEARHTAEFVELIDQLFDSLNISSESAPDGKPFKWQYLSKVQLQMNLHIWNFGTFCLKFENGNYSTWKQVKML